MPTGQDTYLTYSKTATGPTRGVTPKTTEHNFIKRIIGKSEAEVTTTKRLRSKFVLLKLSTDRHDHRAASLRHAADVLVASVSDR